MYFLCLSVIEKLTLKKPLIRILSRIFSGNGTFLQIPESIIPGCRLFTVTPAAKTSSKYQ
jgi:hypothetical protein